MNILDLKDIKYWQTIYLDKGDVWIGISDTLGLTLSADTKDGLTEIISEGIDLLILDLKEDGELDQFCKERNLSYEIR